MIPEEVKQLGLDAFERVGEESTTTYERRVSSLVEVTTVSEIAPHWSGHSSHFSVLFQEFEGDGDWRDELESTPNGDGAWSTA